MTPQAAPKLLKFKFDEKALKRKYKDHIDNKPVKPSRPDKPKFRGKSLRTFMSHTEWYILAQESEDCNVDWEDENVRDDSEEQSVFVINNPEYLKKLIPQSHKAEKMIQTDPTRSKLDIALT